MNPWIMKVAVITDCDNELGVCIIEELSKVGMIAIGFARTDKIVEAITDKLKNITSDKVSEKIVLVKCNITNTTDLRIAFERIIDTYEGVDVLINNAYCNVDCNFSSGRTEEFKEIIDVNINSLVSCSSLAAGSMIKRKSRGHIININDLLAFYLPEESKKNVFIATKGTMTSVNEILRHEFRFLKANVKVTNVACGFMESEAETTNETPKLKCIDVAKIIISILDTPEHLQIHEILLDSVPEYVMIHL